MIGYIFFILKNLVFNFSSVCACAVETHVLGRYVHMDECAGGDQKKASEPPKLEVQAKGQSSTTRVSTSY